MFVSTQLVVAALAVLLQEAPAQHDSVIESLHVHSSIRYRTATTRFTSVVRNSANYSQLVSFNVAMPTESYILDFAMTTRDVTYRGEIRERTTATVGGTSRFTGQMATSTSASNKFLVSKQVGAGDTITFSLSYTQLLKRKKAIYEHQIFLHPGQAVKDMYVELIILENTRLTTLNVPALRDFSTARREHEANNSLVRIDRPSPESAHLVFVPDTEQQGPSGLSHIFVVQYDVEHNPVGDIVVNDGFFIHFLSVDSVALPKDIVFVLDVSGSMLGDKMAQMKDAINEILGDLRAEDTFNIVIFNHFASAWANGLVDASTYNINNAMNYVANLVASGGTSISLGITEGRSLYKSSTDSNRVRMIFFLTDGHDRSYVPDDPAIPIYGLAFGDHADLDYIKSLSSKNGGFSRKVYTDIQAATQVTNFYEEISRVSYQDVQVVYPAGTVDESTLTTTDFTSVFEGSELVITGRLNKNVTRFGAEILLGGQNETKGLRSEMKDIQDFAPNISSVISESAASIIFNNEPMPLEKIWAVITIEQKLKEDETKATSVVDTKNLEEVLGLAIKYQLGTPLTSIVVDDPFSGGQLLESAVQSDKERLDTRTYHFIRARPPPTTRAPTTATTRKPMCPLNGSVDEVVKSVILDLKTVPRVVKMCLGIRGNALTDLVKNIRHIKRWNENKTRQFCEERDQSQGTVSSRGQYLGASRGNQNKGVKKTFLKMFLISLKVYDNFRSVCIKSSEMFRKKTKYLLLKRKDGPSLYYLTGHRIRNSTEVSPNRMLIQSSKGEMATIFLGTRTSWRITGDADFTFQINNSSQLSFKVETLNVTIQRMVSSKAVKYFIAVFIENHLNQRSRGILGDALIKTALRRRQRLTVSSKSEPATHQDIWHCPAPGYRPAGLRKYRHRPKALVPFYLSLLVDLMKNVQLRVFS